MQFLNCKITLSFSNQKIKDRSETLINKGKYEVKIKFIVSLIVLDLKTRGEEYARIKYALKKMGKPVDEFDMVIAAHALSEGLTVVTDNIKHFEHMPDVKVENWMDR